MFNAIQLILFKVSVVITALFEGITLIEAVLMGDDGFAIIFWHLIHLGY